MNEPAFTHEVFLSHSAKHKAVVRSLAERQPAVRDPLNQERRSNHSRFDLPIWNFKPNAP